MAKLDKKLESHGKWGKNRKERVDTRFNKIMGYLDAKAETVVRLLGEEKLNLENLLKAFERRYGYRPTKEDVDLGVRETKQKRGTAFVLAAIETANLTFVLWYWMHEMAPALAVAIIVAICQAGDAAHRESKKGQRPKESMGAYHLRLIFKHSLLIGICAFVGMISGLRLMNLAKEKRIEEMLAGIENSPDGAMYVFLAFAIGFCSFAVAILLAEKWHKYKQDKKKWYPIHEAMKLCSSLAAENDFLRAELKGNEEKRTAKHRSIDDHVRRKDARSIWWDGTKQQLRKYFSKDTDGTPRTPILNTLTLLFLFWTTSAYSQSFFSSFMGHEGKLTQTVYVVLVDQSLSASKKLSEHLPFILKTIVLQLEPGDEIVLLSIDGGMRASPQTLFRKEIPQNDFVYRHNSLAAMLGIRIALTDHLDSLLSIRNAEFRTKTGIFYTIVHALSIVRSEKKAIVLILSDMIEDSSVSQFTAGFDEPAVMQTLRRNSLIPEMNGIEVLILTPVASMKDASLTIRIKRFWESYFQTARASMRWFGPDYLGFENYMQTRKRINASK